MQILSRTISIQTKTGTKVTSLQLPSPPNTPSPVTLRPTNAHLQPTGASTETEDVCLLELLLELALAALIAIRSTSNPTISHAMTDTIAELSKLADAEAPSTGNDANIPTSTPTSLKSQGVQTNKSYVDITKQGQVESKAAHTTMTRPPPPVTSLKKPTKLTKPTQPVTQ